MPSDEVLKQELIAIGYPEKTLETIENKGFERIGHTIWQSSKYPISIDLPRSGPELGITFGGIGLPWRTRLLATFERYTPLNGPTYLRYWLASTNRHYSCDETKWYATIEEMIARSLTGEEIYPK